MTEARTIAKELRKLLNEKAWTIHDVMRGLVVLANGKLKQEPLQELQPCKS